MTDPVVATRTQIVPEWIGHYPAAVLHVSRDGLILYSNGQLDRQLGNTIEGRQLRSLVDRASSEGKVRRILAQTVASSVDTPQVWELILREGAELSDPRQFVCTVDDDGESIWLMEQLRDARATMLGERLLETNSELVSTHRELSQQRARLARAHSDLQERTSELERSNAALDEFAHVISHDLKSPLRAISTFSEWLDKDLAGQLQGEAPEYISLLRDNVALLGEMIDGVLSYARAGRNVTRAERVDVDSLVRDVVQLLAPAHQMVEILPGLPVLHTERAPLRQVFLNLIGNALKYGVSQGGHIVVGARANGLHTEFFVQDDGPGIALRLQERIWMLFATFPSAQSGDGALRGTGIGLAVVRKLAEARGGRAWVDSEAGGGATFRVLWPCEDEPARIDGE